SATAETAAPPVREEAPLPADRFMNREIGWLRFNQRVLELAEDTTLPLLERALFLSIFSSNLDEFFMVRVAGLKRRLATGVTVSSRWSPRAQLNEISAVTHELMERHARCFHSSVAPALAEAGIRIVRWNDLTGSEAQRMHRIFGSAIYPVLTPLAVDPSHPSPYISGRSLDLAVTVRDPHT